ncbi:hypothetical protein [Pseudoalteromonas sp. Of7M-16]|uniref:hypothetical protein n=1 Tax=Pseudoalteromonas sp. Of7M-16 TaxID=2917756 RepID=UPI001EF4F394|nr:hypothetical protein [Pseudoalteromonas sp. Of7M-16]MCG7550155.1 hypothetical protein [Pseudoalteromonas sp. Of7M-16]
MMKKRSTILISAAILSFNSMAVTDVEMKVGKLSKKTKQQHQTIAQRLAESNCQYVINPISDARDNKEAISWSVNATGVQAWLDNVHKDVLSPLLPTHPRDITIELTPKLNKLYTYNESMNINGMAVSTVDYTVNGQAPNKFYVRGFHSKTNWANGDSEFVESAERATAQMVTKLLNNLPAICEKATAA